MPTIIHYLRTHSATAIVAALFVLIAGGSALLHAGKTDGETTMGSAIQEVEVVTITPQQIRIWNEFSGRLEATDHVNIRPRVGGAITDVLFKEGAIVQQGDPLFIIDPRPYKASLERAKARMQAASSEMRLARTEFNRAKQLVDKKVISKSRYDSAYHSYKAASANVSAAKAELEQAELDYEHAHIKAPVTGRASRAEITEGNVIEAGPNAPILTSIVSTEQLYAEFDVDEQTYLKTVRASTTGNMPVAVTLPGDDGTVYHGVIHAFDNQLDTNSGTIRARAILDNIDGALIPGMFVNVNLGSASPQATLLVNEQAIGTDQSKKYVYVVTPENEVAYREVTLGHTIKGKRVILSGVSAGDRVLVNSQQRVQPGILVEPVEAAL